MSRFDSPLFRRSLERQADELLRGDNPANRVPVKVAQRLLNIVDSEPKRGVVIFDSGWYCPIPGKPLPEIASFFVEPSTAHET